MKSWVMLGILATALLAAGVAGAAVESAAEFLSIVDQRTSAASSRPTRPCC